MCKAVCLVLLALALAAVAQAEIVAVSGGISPPAPTLGPFEMTPFPPDDRPIGGFVDSVASPLGGSVQFSPALSHRRSGSGWLGWSHGYTGDVYVLWDASPVSITLDLPADTRAFYLYAASDGVASLTVRAQAGDAVSFLLGGGYDAEYAGFYTTSPGELIETITVTSTFTDVAIGEFGIAVPEPAAPWVLLALLVHLTRRKLRP